jgi:4-amino-4-deoxy-L-arabinose transferase-like glycosyltransferase
VAALAGVLTPVFFVSSLTIMCDVLMMAFWVFAVHLWMRGVPTGRHGLLALAGVLIALSALSKYLGMALLPLLIAFAIARTRRVGWWALYLAIPLGVLVAYHVATQRLYGHSLLSDAAGAAGVAPSQFGRLTLAKTWVGLTFTGGCIASAFFFARQLWGWRVVALGGAAVGALMGVMASWTTFGLARLPGAVFDHSLLTLQLAGWGLVGASLLVLAALDLRRRRDADSLLLCLWTLGVFGFATFVNQSTNGRSLLPMVVPAGILIARRLEWRARPRAPGRLPATVVPLAAAALLSLAVTWADYRLAETARVGATRLLDTYPVTARPLWFQGHWGFQYYMERRGARAVEATPRFAVGDLVAMPATGANMFAMPPEWSFVREILEVPSSGWLATMNAAAGAGFHSDGFGPLAFAVGAIPPERFTVYEIRPRDAPR